jgi:uncharacterized membrane protein
MLFNVSWWAWLLVYGSVVGWGILFSRILAMILVIVCLFLFLSIFDFRSDAAHQADIARAYAWRHHSVGQDQLNTHDQWIRQYEH